MIINYRWIISYIPHRVRGVGSARRATPVGTAVAFVNVTSVYRVKYCIVYAIYPYRRDRIHAVFIVYIRPPVGVARSRLILSVLTVGCRDCVSESTAREADETPHVQVLDTIALRCGSWFDLVTSTIRRIVPSITRTGAGYTRTHVRAKARTARARFTPLACAHGSPLLSAANIEASP